MATGNPRPGKWKLLLLGGVIALVVLGISIIGGTILAYKKTRPAPLDVQSIEKPAPSGPVLLTWKGVEFRKGSVVRVTSWAGTIKGSESGADAELSVEAGRVGVVVDAKYVVSEYNKQMGGQTQVILVRWYKQGWSCMPQFWRTLQVESFESSIHADYLAVEK